MKTEKPPITVNEIEIAIAKYYDVRQNIIVPNISWGFTWKDKDVWHSLHECDVLVVRKTGYAIEVEIKRSKSDLLNDFKKKHKHESNKIKELYYAIPMDNVDEWSELIPKHAGIIAYDKPVSTTYVRTYVRKIRGAKTNMKATKLTIEEQLKIAKLGTMRIWGLKEKLIENIKERCDEN